MDEVRPVVRTTPEAIDLQRTFREMLDAGNRSVALEASSHASVLHRLDRVRFDALVFTNLSQDHLDFHESMEDYFAAKRKLFTGAAPTPAAVNIGDEWGRRLAEELAFTNRAPLITFGLADDAEIRPDQLELGATGARFTAGGIEIESNLRGRFNVENVLGVIAAAILLDVAEDEIAAGIAALEGVPGRFEAVDEGQPFSVVVDYSHKPDALDNVLRTARELAEGRVIVRLRGRRRPRPSEAPADGTRSPATSPTWSSSPRTTPAARIRWRSSRTSSRAPAPTSRSIRTGARRSSARSSLAEAGDVVVIAGKGHEQGQEIAGEKLAFDDRVVAREALRA